VEIKIDDNGGTVTKHRQFITLGRSIIAYLIGLTAGAMTFFPTLIAGSPRPFSVPVEHGFLRFVGAEFGAALFGLAIFAVPISPFYLAGMIIAQRVGTRHWFYFTTMGIALSLGLWAALTFLWHHGVNLHSQFDFVSRLVVPIGAISGLACWLFLYLTCARESI
jgi:hypothetical protein